MMTQVKGCHNCAHGLADRVFCEGCLTPLKEDGSFAYRNHMEGDPRIRRLKLQRSGEINIVIGGRGEHEVNAKWAIDTAYRTLSNVCEHCGGFCWKKNPTTLIVDKPYGGVFTLEYENRKLARIYREREQIPKKLWWTASSERVNM